jgi:regulator of nucleoside diphosphate kinase
VTDTERKNDLKQLLEKINRAKVVNPKSIPGDIVTMNSKIHLEDLDSKTDMTLRLVFPRDEDVMHGRISITTPMGTALLGCRVGDIAEWRIRMGGTKFKAKIIGILYQPEKYGHQGM